MIHSCAMRMLLAGGLFCVVCLTPMSAAAQRGAPGPVAQLNAEAESTHSMCPSCFEGLSPEHHHHEQPPV